MKALVCSPAVHRALRSLGGSLLGSVPRTCPHCAAPLVSSTARIAALASLTGMADFAGPAFSGDEVRS